MRFLCSIGFGRYLAFGRKAERSRLISECNGIVKRGTGIRSFKYNGKARNVTIGPEYCRHKVSWGREVVERSVIEHNKKLYLVAVDNNDGHQVKAFRFDNIEDFYFKLT